MSAELLEGEFVDLRRLSVEHAAITLAWRQGERAKLLNRGAATLEQQTAWIASRSESENNYLITLKSGVLVGMLSLIGIHAVNRHAESARFLIGDEAAVCGIPAAAEAMKLLYHRAFVELGLVRVYGTVASDNTLMVKWQKFMGMKEEGRMRQHYFIDGHFQDAVMVGILESEYRSVALPRLKAMIAAAQPRASAST